MRIRRGIAFPESEILSILGHGNSTSRTREKIIPLPPEIAMNIRCNRYDRQAYGCRSLAAWALPAQHIGP
jgi:hypothetical protein